MVVARKYVVKRRFQGLPKRSDFDILQQELPELKSGEILIKNEFISVDPYMRVYNERFNVPYDQFGFNVGVVLESKDANVQVGTRIVSHNGWCDYYVWDLKAKSGDADNPTYKLPDLKSLPSSLGIGAVGMPGATAYFGLLEICKPKAGETVVVTSAAGAVGSIAGQIAKIKGCKVIGFAGSDKKFEWLEKELGFDKALNYKKVDISNALKEAAPEGVDCYFDNVGGEISSLIMKQMNKHGRVSVCGSISVYNEDYANLPKVTTLQLSILSKELKVEGFIITRWAKEWDQAFEALTGWIKSGQIKVQEHVTEGFDKIYDAFVEMLSGENIGKAIVKI